MGFFGPILLPLVDEGSTPIIRRAMHRARIVGNFALVQAAVQLIGFLSGILLVRFLSQPEYAYFTIANSMQATINVLADIGISVGLVSIGGRVWQDRHRFGELISTALQLRRKLGTVAIVAITPVLCFMLIKNGASALYSGLLVVLVLFGVLLQLSLGVLGVVPRLRSDIGLIQVIDFSAALARLLVLLALVFLFLNGAIAIAVGSAALLLQYVMLHRYVVRVIDLHAPANEEDRHAMRGFIRSLAPNAVFFCFQGQITIFLISFFGKGINSIAEVGALGRLAMIFAVLSNLLMNICVPAFARCQSERKLRWLYLAIVGGVVGFSSLVVFAAVVFPNAFLFVLGGKYAHLQRELVYMVGGAVLYALVGTVWQLNASKAWIAGSWLYIPLTIGTQLLLMPFIDFSSVSGVLVFNLISVLPNLLLNVVLSYRGFRSLAARAA